MSEGLTKKRLEWVLTEQAAEQIREFLSGKDEESGMTADEVLLAHLGMGFSLNVTVAVSAIPPETEPDSRIEVVSK